MNKGVRKKLLIGLGIIFAISLQIIINTYEKREVMICKVFADNNVIDSKGELMVEAKANGEYMTQEDIEGLLKHICSLGEVDSRLCEITKDETGWHMSAQGESLVIKVDTGVFNEGNETLINMKFTSENSEYIRENGRILELENKILKFCSSIQMKVVNHSLVLEGRFPGRLEHEFIEKNTSEIYRRLSGESISGKYVDGRYISYGFTRLIEDYIVVENERINLNIVYTYDEKENTTKMYLATPVINTEY